MGESQGYEDISKETMDNASRAAESLDVARATDTPWERSTQEGKDYDAVWNMQREALAVDAARDLGIDPALVESHTSETRASMEEYLQAREASDAAAKALEEASANLEAARDAVIATAKAVSSERAA